MSQDMKSHNSKKKVAFFVKEELDSFLNEVYDLLSREFEVKKIILKEEVACSMEKGCAEVDEGMTWADICWFEWCDELIAYGSKHKIASDKKIICRIHSYEVFTDYPKMVNWENVDKIIFVAKHIKDFAVEHFKLEKSKTVVIPNWIDTSKYNFRQGHQGYNIAYAGYINHKKGPMLLLQTFKAMYDADSRYKLYIAGAFQDHRDILYFKQMINEWRLEKNIIYEGWKDNLDQWLEDKDYILCTSILESQNMSIMQAMSKGIKPIIHNFVGASAIYDRKYIFNTINEAVEILKGDYASEDYREFVEEKYSKQVLGDRLLKEMKIIEEACNKNPLVSVIMAVYNRERYVEEAIKSVLNQSYKNIELIIVNDGSKDGSENIIKTFADSRIKYYSNENKGQLKALKFGYEKVQGDFITRVDSDDLIHKDYIKTCLEPMLINSKLQFVYTDFFTIDEKGAITSITKFNDYNNSIELIMDAFSGCTSVIPDVAFFRREYLPNVILNYTKENVPFYLDNILNHLYLHIKTPLYLYRQHEENYAKDTKNLKVVIEGNIKFIELLFRRYFVQMNLNGDYEGNKNIYFKSFSEFLINLSEYYKENPNSEKSEALAEIPATIKALGEGWLNKIKESKNKKLNYLLQGEINKRILIVSTDDPLEGRAVGGKHTHIHLLSKGLNEENIPNKLIVSKLTSEISINIKKANAYMAQQINEENSLDTIETTGDASFFYTIYAIQKQLEDKIERAIEENYYSVISCQDVIATMAAIKVRERKKFIIPIVSTLHGYFTNENVDYGGIIGDSEVYKYFIQYEKTAYEGSDRIITVDTRIKNYVKAFNLQEEPVINVLKNAADDLSFSNDLDNTLKNNLNTILVPRRLVPKNGVIYGVKAVEELLKRGIDNINLVIAGDGIERDAIENYIEASQVESKNHKVKLKDVIQLLGSVPHDEIQEYYRKAKYVLIPSIKSNNVEEATSVALLEGMACGKVVIASAVGGMKEIIENGVNGFLVDASKVLELADTLQQVISLSKEAYTLIGAQAMKDVKENYGYREHAKKFLNLLHEG